MLKVTARLFAAGKRDRFGDNAGGCAASDQPRCNFYGLATGVIQPKRRVKFCPLVVNINGHKLLLDQAVLLAASRDFNFGSSDGQIASTNFDGYQRRSRRRTRDSFADNCVP